MRELLLITTFKEFDGGEDAKIQEYWLRHLHNQTYKKFKLLVTNYREKNVHHYLENSRIEFYYFQSKYDCMFSWTEMTSNSFDIIREGENIVVWISPDYMLDDDFFEAIVSNFYPGDGGTAFPNRQCLSLRDFNSCIMYDEHYERAVSSIFEYNPNKHLPEVLYCDGDLLLDGKWQNTFNNHHILGPAPGLSLHIYFQTLPKRLINIVCFSNASKIINKANLTDYSDSEDVPESHVWTGESDDILRRYIKNIGISKGFLTGTVFRSAKLYGLCRYKIIGSASCKNRYYLYILRFATYPYGKFIFIQKLLTLKNKMLALTGRGS